MAIGEGMHKERSGSGAGSMAIALGKMSCAEGNFYICLLAQSSKHHMCIYDIIHSQHMC